MAEERITLAITGASGAQYGLRLLQCLVGSGVQVFCLVSRAAKVVINTETSLTLPEADQELQSFLQNFAAAKEGQLTVLSHEDWMSPVASGSGAPSKMVICPCSSGTLSAIACGASNNLIERAADVVLKERRQLILVHRESPLSEIHLENMLKLTRMGAVILPASPGFYHQPKSVEDMVDFMAARIMQTLDIKQELMPRWGESYIN
ncbi:aromatic acid decarboxylase [Endozoicomonas sp. OPT23]|uniref:flavin prenyltransferase UbiX n=1 Tax=Endozoicomonas sp. OPT23 TaxID=2072845 RepID=UPI00129A545B|nr:flavin prenyltransferase UbiX [Endozoicomonas sp. OPT23]MRI33597.1 aromatic acid decarboxylase [Endozoicomonas sp. OPT23]